MNLTGALLSDIVDIDFNILRRRGNKEQDGKGNAAPLTPSTVSTVGLRRATDLYSISLFNDSGLDVLICPMALITASSIGPKRVLDQDHPGCILVESRSGVSLDSYFGGGVSDFLSGVGHSLALALAPSTLAQTGMRQVVLDLPMTRNKGRSVSLHQLHPLEPPNSDELDSIKRRFSPETVISDPPTHAYEFHAIEPVVEWCMQNQRLRSSTTDIFSLDSGKDLLSSTTWSPGDDLISSHDLPEGLFYSRDRAASSSQSSDRINGRLSVSTTRSLTGGTNWLRPHLHDDSPEWTDMTCTLRMARDRVMLPDNNWIWANEWTVDLSGVYGDATDADGWEYETDFEAFSRSRRFYKRGDMCRRRRWTRTRMIKPPRLTDPKRSLTFVWETQCEEKHGNFVIKVTSPINLHNCTSISLHFFAYSYSWEREMMIGSTHPGGNLSIPILFSSATYLRLATIKENSSVASQSLMDYHYSDKLVILPTSNTSSVFLRTSLKRKNKKASLTNNTSNSDKLHFLVHIQTKKGVTDIYVEPVLRVVNLLPCHLQYQLGEAIERNGKDSERFITKREEQDICIGKESQSGAIDPKLKPHISLRIPGYRWSTWQRIVNRKANSHTWQPPASEEDLLYEANKEDADHADEYKTIVKFERSVVGGEPLHLILSVEVGHCPTLRIYAQYWIMDKTGFGLRFADGFKDLLGNSPMEDSSRRSYLEPKDMRDPGMRKDMELVGHQWSFGMSGMSLYFSKKEKIAMAIECGADDKESQWIKSRWTAAMDVSNVMPNTVFFCDEEDGPRRFELSLNVKLAPSIFARTKFITIFPRYQIVNLLSSKLYVAQEGCLRSEIFIPSQSSVPFHWDQSSLPPKVRLSLKRNLGKADNQMLFNSDSWTNGSIQLDKVGITSMRLPTEEEREAEPVVLQVEVRLATKEQSSAVVVVIWSSSDSSNPLYRLRNRSPHTILCSQPLVDDRDESGVGVADDLLLSYDGCSAKDGPHNQRQRSTALRNLKNDRSKNRMNNWQKRKKKKEQLVPAVGFECGIIDGFVRADSQEEYVWNLQPGQVTCFGFDDPEKAHTIEWTCLELNGSLNQNNVVGENIGILDVDALGSSSILTLPDGKQVRCQIRAEHSTKVIEFVEVDMEHISTLVSRVSSVSPTQLLFPQMHHRALLEMGKKVNAPLVAMDEEIDDESVIFTLRMDLPGITISVIDNAAETISGREILLLQAESWMVEFSQNREGYHELELRLMSLQVDNHVNKSIHPVLVGTFKLMHRC